MLSLVLHFVAGILCVQQLAALPGVPWQAAGALVIGMMAWLRSWKVVFFGAGMLWAILFASARLGDRLPESLAGRDFQVQGVVANLPDYENNRVRFNFVVDPAFREVVAKEPAHQRIPDKIRLTWYFPEVEIKAGQKWRLNVRLKPPHGNFNPGGVDYERWLFAEGIGATGYIRQEPPPALLQDAVDLFNIENWRQEISGRLDKLHISPDSLAIIKALTIGNGDSLTQTQWEVFRATGTTHLMVISGSHIALVAGLAYFLVVKFWARVGVMVWPPQRVAAVSAILAAFVYAGLTGFGIPAQRAMLMFAVVMLAVFSQRNTNAYSILVLVLFVVLIDDPLAVLRPGFWLSFCAVGLIIYSLGGRLKPPGFIASAMRINWITSIGLWPLLLFFFQQVSLISPLVNLIAAPVVGLIVVPFALMATLAMFISPYWAEKLFVPLDYLLQGLWVLMNQCAQLPAAFINQGEPSWWALGAAMLGLVLLFAPKGMPCRWLGLAMLLPMLFADTESITPGTVKLTLLDVGQGLSAVVQTANHVLVYDTGAKFSSTSDSGQSVVLPFLRSQNIRRIDTLLISHGDNDHIGGAISVLDNIDTEQLLTSVPEQLMGYAPIHCRAGQAWFWDGVRFTLLSPMPGARGSGNNNSCVLQVQAREGTALLPGDIEAETESVLVSNYGNQLKSNVLIAPHHGSQTSSTSAFLEAVHPAVVLIPAGYRNPFGHPDPEVVSRYRAYQAVWFNTAEDGALQVVLDNLAETVAWRGEKGKYWSFKK